MMKLRSFVIVLALFFTACPYQGECQKVIAHHVPESATQCKHECAKAVAKGGAGPYVSETNYFRCLKTCPGVIVVEQCLE